MRDALLQSPAKAGDLLGRDLDNSFKIQELIDFPEIIHFVEFSPLFFSEFFFFEQKSDLKRFVVYTLRILHILHSFYCKNNYS